MSHLLISGQKCMLSSKVDIYSHRTVSCVINNISWWNQEPACQQFSCKTIQNCQSCWHSHGMKGKYKMQGKVNCLLKKINVKNMVKPKVAPRYGHDVKC